MSGLTQYRNLQAKTVESSRPEREPPEQQLRGPHPQRGTSARYGVRLSYRDRGRRNQSFSSGGMSRTFCAASARSIAFSVATAASDLIAAWPLITTPAIEADHFQTPRSMP